MKIAYVFAEDAASPAVQSGRPASLLTEFERRGLGIVRAFPLDLPSSPAALAKQAGYRLLGKHHRADRADARLDALVAQFSARTAGREFDLIFSPGSEAISHLATPVPATFCADATFANMVDYYWDFTGLSEEYLRQGHAQEAAALERAALAVYPSDWAARSAIDDYGADPARVAVIPFGANLGAGNRRAEVLAAIDARSRSPLRLLFVGRHWARKGGDLVLATAHCLRAHGHPVVVDIVGCEVPGRHPEEPWIHRHGLLSQRDPTAMALLRELYAQAHFVFVPSQAEAFGLTFAEASAFGVPSIATRTGGIPGVVHEGRNGFLLPPGAPAADYADVIVAAFTDPARHRALCVSAFEEFDQRLNWGAFTDRFLDLVHQRLGLPVDSATRLQPVA